MTEVHSSGRSCEVEVADVTGFFQHGWHSWCETGWIDPSGPRQVISNPRERLGHDDPAHAFDTTSGGSGFGAVEHGRGSITLLGALAGGAWVRLDNHRLTGSYEGTAGAWVTLTGPETEVLTRYAELLAEHLGGSRGGPPIRLWASWYSFYEDVTETRMHDVLAGLDGLDFDVVQVDDGWERAIGDWEPNDDFPSGMADMAGRIRDSGRRAGLWLAPFIARSNSQLAADRPELLLRDVDGEPVVAGVNWGGPYWALDVTKEATLDHITDIMAGYHRAGYDFFKLDFIYAAAFPGKHAKPVPRADAYRNACKRIRNVVGDDAYLLACGAPIIESIGVFDGIRIGPDVGSEWENGTRAAVRPAMATAIHRLWLQPAIDTDPDVVYFRSRDTELSEATRQHLQALARIARFLGTSDPPEWLEPDERDRLAAFLTEPAATEQLSRYRWRVAGTQLDFAAAISSDRDEPRWEEAG